VIAEIAVPELALDDDQRHAFARHLDRVSVAQLMGAKRRRTPAAAAVRRSSARAAAGDQCRPRVAPLETQRSGPGARADRRARAQAVPIPMRPCRLRDGARPCRAGPRLSRDVDRIALGKRERLLDAQPGPPHDHDQSTQPATVRVVAGGAHDRDDLLDLRRIGRLAQTLVAWSVAGVECRQRRGRSTSTSAIEQKLRHDPSSDSWTEPDCRRQLSAADPAGRRAIASDTEQRSKRNPEHYRACLRLSHKSPEEARRGCPDRRGTSAAIPVG
jgi:hypothetical protein